MGIPGTDGIFISKIKRYGGGYGQQHRRAQNTDICQPHRILFHPVNQTGNRSKMPGFIVIGRSLFQRLQKRHRSCHKQGIRSRHYQENGHKQVVYRLQHIFRADGHPVTGAGEHQAGNGQYPAGFGFPLPCPAALQKFYRIGNMNLPQIIQQNAGKNCQKQQERNPYGLQGNGKLQWGFYTVDFQQKQEEQTGQKDASPRSKQETSREHQQTFTA